MDGRLAILRPFNSTSVSSDDGRLAIKICVQWNPVYGLEDFASSGARNFDI